MNGMKSLLGLLLVSAAVQAGTELGNGVENYQEEDMNAWFTGDHVVKYCLVVSSGFGLNKAQLDSEIQSALNTWQNYFVSREVLTDFEEWRDQYGAKILHRGLSTHLKFQECDGSEDLKFYFGTNDDLTSPYRTRETNALAFAQKTAFDSKTGWGRGFVWIAPPDHINSGYPNWNYANALRGILIHELGHVFGCQHQDGTIMDRRLSLYVRNADSTNWSRARLTQIDQDAELVSPGNGRFSFVGSPLDFGTPLTDGFRLLMGRDPVGNIKTRAVGKDGSGFFTSDQTLPELAIDFEDDVGSGHFTAEFSTLVTFIQGALQLVTLGLWTNPDQEPREMRSVRASFGAAYVATMKSAAGSPLTMIVNRNLSCFYESDLNGIRTVGSPQARLLVVHPDAHGPQRLIFESYSEEQ